MTFDDCTVDGRDAGVGDLVAWTERVGTGQRHTVAWIAKETGGTFELEVQQSDGPSAYTRGAVLRRQAAALQKRGLRRQPRITERAPAEVAEQLTFDW